MSADIQSVDTNLFSSQKEMETLFSKHQVMPFLRQECRDAGFDDDLDEVGIPVKFGIDLMCQMILHKRANLVTLVGILHKHFTETEDKSQHQLCADMILRAVEEDVIDYDDVTDMFIVRPDLDIDDPTQRQLDQFQYPLPMIEHPEPVTTNMETGYQTIRGSLILRNNHHDQDICLDHLNRLNIIPLRLNEDVVAFIQNQWADLDKRRKDETQEDFRKRRKAFNKYDRTSREVIEALMAAGNRFWLTHKYDKRGRTYSQGYHVNYQGNDWNKSCVEFAEGEPLNKE